MTETRGRLIALGVFCASAGCFPQERVGLPEGSRSLIVINVPAELGLLEPAQRVNVFAFDLSAPVPPTDTLTIAAEDELLALGYDTPLAALGIAPGNQQVLEGQDSQRLPDPARLLVATSADRAWHVAELADYAPFLSKLRLPDVSDAMCRGLNAAGCYQRTGSGLSCRPSCGPYQPQLPLEPQAALLPLFTPCAGGWYESDEGSVRVCRPPELIDCPPGQNQWLGSIGCQPIGQPCPSGAFAELGPGAYYVDNQNTLGGSGTLADPFHGLAHALASVPSGSTLALSKGSFAEAVSLTDATLIGACAELTMLEAPAASTTAVRVTGHAQLANISVRSNAPIDVSGRLELDGVELIGGGVLVVDGGVVVGREVVASDARDGAFDVRGGALTLSRSTVANAVDSAIRAEDQAEVELEDTRIFGTRAGPREAASLKISAGSELRATRLEVSRTAVNGLISSDDSHVQLDQARFIGFGPGPRQGIRVDKCQALDGSEQRHLSATRLWVEGQTVEGILVADACRVGLGNVVVKSSASNAIVVTTGASLALDRAQITGAGWALFASTSTIGARDLNVDTATSAVVASDRSVIEVSRVTVRGCSNIGINLAHRGTIVRAQDVIIEPGDRGEPGFLPTHVQMGVLVSGNGRFEGERMSIVDAFGNGVHVECDASARLSDTYIGGAGHEGIIVARASAELTRVSIARAKCVGLHALDATVMGSDLNVGATGSGDCGYFGGKDQVQTNGSGIVSRAAPRNVVCSSIRPPATLSLSAFLSSSNQLDGVVLGDDTRGVHLDHGALLDNLGAGMTVPVRVPFSPSNSLTESVFFRGNGGDALDYRDLD